MDVVVEHRVVPGQLDQFADMPQLLRRARYEILVTDLDVRVRREARSVPTCLADPCIPQARRLLDRLRPKPEPSVRERHGAAVADHVDEPGLGNVSGDQRHVEDVRRRLVAPPRLVANLRVEAVEDP